MEEIPSILTDIFPKWSREQVFWFINPAYHYSTQRNDMLKWITGGLWDIMRMYVIAKLAKHFSLYLFLAVVVLLGYEIAGFLMLLWDFKHTHIMFYDLLVTAMLMIKGVFKGYKTETIGRIKSLF